MSPWLTTPLFFLLLISIALSSSFSNAAELKTLAARVSRDSATGFYAIQMHQKTPLQAERLVLDIAAPTLLPPTAAFSAALPFARCPMRGVAATSATALVFVTTIPATSTFITPTSTSRPWAISPKTLWLSPLSTVSNLQFLDSPSPVRPVF